MKKALFSFFFVLPLMTLFAQKKPLDHSVYDGWQSIGERQISPNGKWVVYTIDVQEGDNELVIQSSDARSKLTIPRGYNATVTSDNRYVIFKIKPLFKDTREAKIKKKKPEEFPKDSLGIVVLGNDSVWKKPLVAGFKVPEVFNGWIAYTLEKEKGSEKDGADLLLYQVVKNETRKFSQVAEYLFDKNGDRLLVYQTKKAKDSLGMSMVLYHDIFSNQTDTLSRGGVAFKNFVVAENGKQVAYVAQRDSSEKALQQFYGLWFYREGMDSAQLVVNRKSTGMQLGMTVSEFGNLSFSKNNNRLFFGSSAILPPKDTTIPDIDKVSLDIWHYKEDYLQTVQQVRANRDLRESFLAVYDIETGWVKQLASRELPTVMMTNEGDGDQFVGITDFGKRVESQWTGNTKKDIYLIDVNTGKARLIKENLEGVIAPSYVSPSGKYVAWYDYKSKAYFVHDGNTARNLTAGIKVKLYDEGHDSPSEPSPYGGMGWQTGDSALFVYDRFEIWKLDVTGKAAPVRVFATQDPRKKNIVIRRVITDREEKYIKPEERQVFSLFSEENKSFRIWQSSLNKPEALPVVNTGYDYGNPIKAKDAETFLFTRENFRESPDLFTQASGGTETRLSAINPQQSDYWWGTAELISWKAYNGKQATGIVYKPENFDPKKKYPMICYFYEEMSNTLHTYYAPAPIRSAINIPFYTSRGYVIFVPDIKYKIGYPGQGAYDYVVSGARAVVRKGYVDSTRMAIQGHSWGGYQVAYLITRTNLFKAAWSGAPVVNMTSAYGGIRWESGLNRQFQYEKTQSRIGATLWEKKQLYLENSPLFYMDRVKTPVVIMHNDADGAVPWYQGIEMFTALRRLGKQVWMLNYNGEGHGLTVRKDRLDYQIRMQQFFDWILKGDKPTRWITEGVPYLEKGKDWGLEQVNEK